MKTYNVQEESPSGQTLWVKTTEEVPLASEMVTTDDEGLATFSYTPAEGGSYKIVATVADACRG
jgi:hypothetical protein